MTECLAPLMFLWCISDHMPPAFRRPRCLFIAIDLVTRLPLHLSLDELEDQSGSIGGEGGRDVGGSSNCYVVPELLDTLLALLQPRVGELSTGQLATVLAALAR